MDGVCVCLEVISSQSARRTHGVLQQHVLGMCPRQLENTSVCVCVTSLILCFAIKVVLCLKHTGFMTHIGGNHYNYLCKQHTPATVRFVAFQVHTYLVKVFWQPVWPCFHFCSLNFANPAFPDMMSPLVMWWHITPWSYRCLSLSNV